MSNRLDLIADLVPVNSVVGDIGSDHAFLAVDLILSGKSPFVIATDINQGPLKNAQNTVDKQNLTDKIDLRLGNGLQPFALNEVDVFVIAGMGGELIKKLIAADKAKAMSASLLILQPMQQAHILREYLLNNGFNIIKDRIAVEGGKYYQIILAKASTEKQKCNQLAYYYGVAADRDKNYYDFLENELVINQKILDKLNPKLHSRAYYKIKQRIIYIRSILCQLP